MAPCPCPDHGKGRGDRSYSVSITESDEGHVLIKCHAGCDIEKMCAAMQIKVYELFARTSTPTRSRTRRDPAAVANKLLDAKRKRADLERQVHQIFERSHPIYKNDPADRYLRITRGLEPVITSAWTSDLRYAPRLWHSETKQTFVGMVVAVRDIKGNLRGVHRYYLTQDGKKAAVEPQRKMLGDCLGNGAYLEIFPWDPNSTSDTVIIAEGIESTYAAMREAGFPGIAALSAGGMEQIQIPRSIKVVHIVPDNDANKRGLIAATKLLRRLRQEGFAASMFNFLPPEGKSDWADHG